MGESTAQPLRYYANNLGGLLSLGACLAWLAHAKSAGRETAQAVPETMLIGRDVHDIEDIFQVSHVSSYWRSGPVLNNAMSGVELSDEGRQQRQ